MELRWFNGKLQQWLITPHIDHPNCGKENNSFCPHEWTDIQTVSEDVKEPQQKKQECKNCCNRKPGEAIAVVFETDNYADSKHSIIAKCAICFSAVPCPSEKSLEEKFRSFSMVYQNERLEGDYYDALASIARQHFAEGGK